MKTKEYVRIKKAPYRSIWYADKIGRIFPSLGTWENAYKVDSPDRALYIRKEDVELIVTEKRKAAVGERILITKALASSGVYKNGDILKVREVEHRAVTVEEVSHFIVDSEYEVIVNSEVKNEEADEMKNGKTRYDLAVENAREAIEELRLAAYEQGYEDAKRRIYTKDPAVNAQARRDEIVEQAKADVRNLVIHGLSHYNIDCSKGNETYRVMNYNVEFITDSRERKVTALVTRRHDKKPRHVGRAKAAPSDCFNVHIGKAIALRRALGLAVPDEYLNAPQPTDVRVGDVVQYSKRCATVVAGRPNGFGETKLTTANGLATRIIDDSREEVGE
ncbi:hypothetical protein ABES74_03990 [Bacillus subtilis]